jgi:hypothetical protein
VGDGTPGPCIYMLGKYTTTQSHPQPFLVF